MSKEAWVKVIPWRKELVTAALEGGADAIEIAADSLDSVKQLGRIPVVAPGGDIEPDVDVVSCTIEDPHDAEKIVAISKNKRVVVETTDWRIIPLENLIAQTNNLMVTVHTREEAEIVLHILEKGVGGIVIESDSVNEVREILSIAKGRGEKIELVSAQVKTIRPVGMGDRVCVDTCNELELGEGLLVGNSSGCLFLIHAENLENPYVTPRPFRVNAGPVHSYIRLPYGKTAYLSELEAGDEVLLVNYKGETRVGVVGRLKIERRPLLLVEVERENKCYTHLVQNAETIRFTSPEGHALSVIELKKGNKILVCVEKPGRHFGIKIEETVQEK